MKTNKHGCRSEISGVSDNWQSERANSAAGELRALSESAVREDGSGAVEGGESIQKRSSKLGAIGEQQGVGARQGASPPPGRGGGYQNSCCILNFAANDCPCDPRLAELCRMGLSATQIRVAHAIGLDAFMVLWRIVDAEPALHTDKGDIEIHMRPFRSYLRYQRNRYIEGLVREGLSLPEIRERVRRDLCERISLRHISRIASGN